MCPTWAVHTLLSVVTTAWTQACVTLRNPEESLLSTSCAAQCTICQHTTVLPCHMHRAGGVSPHLLCAANTHQFTVNTTAGDALQAST